MASLAEKNQHVQFGRNNALFLRSLLKMSPQILLASFSIFLISIVDGLVVGNAKGSEALAAVTAMGPFLTIVGMLVAVVHSGASQELPQLLGANNKETEYAGYRATSILTITVAVFIAVAQIPVAAAVISSMGFSAEASTEAWNYSYGLFVANPLDCISTVGSYVLISTGNAVCMLPLSLIEGFINLGADILFVFGFDLGSLGAGIGTALAIGTRCAITLVLIKKKTKFFEFGKQKCKDMALRMIRLGVPDAFSIGLNAIFAWGISWLIMDSLGVEGMAVKTAIGFASSLATMLIDSAVKSARAIIGFRQGLKDYRGISVCFKASAGYIIVIMLVIILLFWLFPEVPYKFYGVKNVPSYGIFAIKIYATSLLFIGLNTLINYYYTLHDRVKMASAMNFLRGLVFPAASITLAVFTLGCEYIWICYLVSNLGVFFINMLVLLRAAPRDWEASQSVQSLSLSITKDQVSSYCERVFETADEWHLGPSDANKFSLVIEEVVAYAKGRGSSDNVKTDLVITADKESITIAIIDNGEAIPELEGEQLESYSNERFSNYDVLKKISRSLTYQRFMNTNVTTVTI